MASVAGGAKSQELLVLEDMCQKFYMGQLGNNMGDAQAAMVALQERPESIPKCQQILDQSDNPYALVVASNALTKLCSRFWNNFTVPQRLEVRNYILSYLANRGTQMQTFVVKSIIHLLCRVTKLGWFDEGDHHQTIVKDALRFLQESREYASIGLKILHQMVIEVSERKMTQFIRTTTVYSHYNSLFLF